MKPLLAILPKRKKKHSERVGKTLKDVGAGKIATYAGLLHDYLERGGSLEDLSDHIEELGLPRQIVQAVQSLSQDENYGTSNQPLTHLKRVLKTIDDEDLRNIVIVAKLADRIDNFRRRRNRDELTKLYRKNTDRLIEYLINQYTGKGKPVRKLMRIYSAIAGE